MRKPHTPKQAAIFAAYAQNPEATSPELREIAEDILGEEISEGYVRTLLASDDDADDDDDAPNGPAITVTLEIPRATAESAVLDGDIPPALRDAVVRAIIDKAMNDRSDSGSDGAVALA